MAAHARAREWKNPGKIEMGERVCLRGDNIIGVEAFANSHGGVPDAGRQTNNSGKHGKMSELLLFPNAFQCFLS